MIMLSRKLTDVFMQLIMKVVHYC